MLRWQTLNTWQYMYGTGCGRMCTNKYMWAWTAIMQKHHSLSDLILGVHCSGVECHYVLHVLIPCYYSISSRWLGLFFKFLRPLLFILTYTVRLSEIRYFFILHLPTSLHVYASGHSLWILDWTCNRRLPLCHVYRDHSVHAPSQWERMLLCNVVSYWLGAYTEWSLCSDSILGYSTGEIQAFYLNVLAVIGAVN